MTEDKFKIYMDKLNSLRTERPLPVFIESGDVPFWVWLIFYTMMAMSIIAVFVERS